MYLYLITPILGIIRNYSKYKEINYILFFRSPFIYIILNILFSSLSIYEILIYERWIMFIYKILYSISNNDYHRNKEKYIKKYKLKY